MLTLMPMAADAEGTDAASGSKVHGRQEALKGKISLDLPEIGGNGTVPLSLTINPMTANPRQGSPILADGNPNAGVATLMFTPLRARRSLDPIGCHDPERRCDREMSDGAVFTEQEP
jgi:sulfur-oxidizing protein SoxY